MTREQKLWGEFKEAEVKAEERFAVFSAPLRATLDSKIKSLTTRIYEAREEYASETNEFREKLERELEPLRQKWLAAYRLPSQE